MNSSEPDSATRKGLAAAILAFSTWGLYPIFYKQLQSIAAIEVLAHRVVWSFLCLAIGLLIWRGVRGLQPGLTSPRTAWLVLLAAGIISLNWFIFIYAVSTGRILEAGLGYFLNPVITTLVGRVVLGERHNRWQNAAIWVAGIGMTLTFVVSGVVPWISLVLAISFALYSLIRKQSELDSANGLLLETLVLVPAAAAFLWISDAQFSGHGTVLMFWLVAAGMLTLVPLLSVVYAAKRIRLSTLGFFQYIAPSAHFVIAIGLYREPVDLARAMALGVTMLAVALYVTGSIRSSGTS